MTAADRILKDLRAGKIITTDNKSCTKYRTNQVPDAIRKLRDRGIDIETIMVSVSCNGRTTRVAQYVLGE